MDLKKIRPTALALLVAALLIGVVGLTTDNTGFQLAAAIVLVVGVLLALRQATGPGGDDA